MNSQDRERLVDELLDRALAQEAAEPPDGLERRILVHLESRAQRRASRLRSGSLWLGIGAAAAVAATVAVLVALGIPRPGTPPVVETLPPAAPPVIAAAPESQPTPVAHTPVPGAARPVASARRPARRETLPRQEVFPARLPLTEQERLLLALVEGQRREAEKVAMLQQTERDGFRKYVETGEVPEARPMPAQDVR